MPYNPYNYVSYANPYPMSSAPQQQAAVQGVIWVNGEAGANAYQMPGGWPVNTPIALWDTNDKVVYWKIINPVGMPIVSVKMRYEIEDQPQMLPAGQSGNDKPDMARYATKDDLEQMKRELLDSMQKSGSNFSQNGSNNRQNNGGSR